MRILVLGAGAVGGYYGGRLLQAGREVTFLVRPQRAKLLADHGLVIKSGQGDAILQSPPTILSADSDEPFDLVLLSCKAYDLDGAINAIAPAIGPETLIIPLLNGMRHLEALDGRFGKTRVLGGTCFISARLGEQGRILHVSDVHRLTYGPRFDEQSSRVEEIAAIMDGASFEARLRRDILLEMWEKWVFLATLAGATCLTRAAIGDMISHGGLDLIETMAEECRSIAAAAGAAPRPESWEWSLGHLTSPDSTVTASMLADLEQGRPTEADHILGDLLQQGRGVSHDGRSFLQLAYMAIKAAEARNARDGFRGEGRQARGTSA